MRTDLNPFDTPKASHFSPDDILALFVDAQGDGEELVNSLLRPQSSTPMHLLGGKGSGKTHLLRYISSDVRAKKHNGSVLTAALTDRYIALYMDAEALNAQKFNGSGVDPEKWRVIFGYYFEMWMAHYLLCAIRSMISEKSTSDIDHDLFIAQSRALFDVEVADRYSSIDELIEYLTGLRKDVDSRASNAPFRSTFDDFGITFSLGKLVFGLPACLSRASASLANLPICYMIDEVENFSAYQQTCFNTLVRYRKDNVSFKFGSRLYGVKTYATIGSEEPIKLGSEFEEVRLDEHLRQLTDRQYREFSAKLIARRLNLAGFDLKGDHAAVKDHFEALDPANDYAAECLKILSNYDSSGKERPYFQKLRTDLTSKAKLTSEVADAVISALHSPDSPLVEKASILMLYRELKPGGAIDPLDCAERIRESAAIYLQNPSNKNSKHREVISHYKLDLLAQVCRDARQPVPYCGFDDIVSLSQGIPRSLLMLLKHIYRRSTFAGELPFKGGRISKQSQTDGVRDASNWFWNDAQPDSNAVGVRESIEAIGLLLRTNRFSDRPAECAVSCISIVPSEATEATKKVLTTAENWSYLIRARWTGSDKNNERRREKYQLSPMLAPRWEVSFSKRGTFEIGDRLLNAIFDESRRGELAGAFKEKTAGMNGIKAIDTTEEQGKLF